MKDLAQIRRQVFLVLLNQVHRIKFDTCHQTCRQWLYLDSIPYGDHINERKSALHFVNCHARQMSSH